MNFFFSKCNIKLTKLTKSIKSINSVVTKLISPSLKSPYSLRKSAVKVCKGHTNIEDIRQSGNKF